MNDNPRPDWFTYLMGFAQHASTRASCPRATCGAAIVIGRRVIATGYNGAPPDHPECIKVGCDMEDGHCQRALHAEENAIGQLVQHGLAIAPGTATVYIYRANVTSVGEGPCRECRKRMMASGIWDYAVDDGQGVVRFDDLRLSVPSTHKSREVISKASDFSVGRGDSPGLFDNPHPDCTFPRGHWCCWHGDCKGVTCCEHGSREHPNSRNVRQPVRAEPISYGGIAYCDNRSSHGPHPWKAGYRYCRGFAFDRT